MINKLALMTGVDIPIPQLAASLHQPTIGEISYLGENKYFSALSLLCFNKDMMIASNPKGAFVLKDMNNFQIFMTMIQDKNGKNIKQDVIDLFLLFFPGYTVQFLPRGIFCNNAAASTSFTIDENNFNVLQETVMNVSGLTSRGSGGNAQYNPRGKRAAEIAAKLMKGRAKASGQTNNEDVLSRYVSILTVGLNAMSLDKCISLTVYQLYDLIERYGLYTAWDIDIRSRLAGGKPDDKPDDWMKPIH